MARSYEDRFEGTDAWYRDEAEAHQIDRDYNFIENELLAKLTPEDGARELFTFWERKTYHLKGHRK
jgi:hypothetical protein